MCKKGITIEAGDADGMVMVLGGAIVNAFVDAQGIPDLTFDVSALPVLSSRSRQAGCSEAAAPLGDRQPQIE